MHKVVSIVLYLMFSRVAVANPAGDTEIVNLVKGLPTQVISIFDGVHGKKKTYRAISMSKVIRKIPGKSSESTSLIFRCADGYQPSAKVRSFRTREAFLAVGEPGNARGFEDVPQGKKLVTPGPYYLVWKNWKKGDSFEEYPWPYQLVGVRYSNLIEEYASIAPKVEDKNSDEHLGFELFVEKAQCIKCHSVNLRGGDLGPELNAPRSVTEYWKSEELPKFIRAASSFRAKSKMPDYPHLSEKEISQIVAYLSFMKK